MQTREALKSNEEKQTKSREMERESINCMQKAVEMLSEENRGMKALLQRQSEALQRQSEALNHIRGQNKTLQQQMQEHHRQDQANQSRVLRVVDDIRLGEHDMPKLLVMSLERKKDSISKDIAHALNPSNFGRNTWRLWFLDPITLRRRQREKMERVTSSKCRGGGCRSMVQPLPCHFRCSRPR